MKQLTDPMQWDELTNKEKTFLLVWKKRKYQDDTPALSLGQLLEFHIAFGNNFHHEESDGRFFNNCLLNPELSVCWDGAELVDMLFYEARLVMKHRFSISRIGEEVEDNI